MDNYLLDIAILPSIVLLIYMYKKDRIDKEPLPLLLLLIVGGLLSCITSYILEMIFSIALFKLNMSAAISLLIEAFIVVALVEEGSKFFFLKLFSWKSKNFNCLYDGLIYSVFVSLGFATGENILYAMDYGVDTAISRAFTAIPGHTAFAVIMGIFYALAKREQANGNKRKAAGKLKVALFTATLLHGLYDYLLMKDSDILIFVWLALMVAIYIFIFATVRIFSRNDKYLKTTTDYDCLNSQSNDRDTVL